MQSSRRKILKKLKQSSAMKEATALDYNKDGDVIISIGIKEADDFFHPYTYRVYELMNPEITDYIEMCEQEVPMSENICLDIYTEESTTSNEKKRIKNAVKRHNAERVVVVEKELKRNLLKGTGLIMLGVLVLILQAFLWKALEIVMLDTLLVVIGWLLLWDGVEFFIFEIPPLKIAQIKHYRLINAKVHIRQYSKKIKRMYNLGQEDEK